MLVALDKFGRMVLPKVIRDAFGLQPGAALEIEERAECIVLKPVLDQTPIVEKDGLLVFRGKAAASMRDAVAEHRRLRMRKLGGMEPVQ